MDNSCSQPAAAVQYHSLLLCLDSTVVIANSSTHDMYIIFGNRITGKKHISGLGTSMFLVFSRSEMVYDYDYDM